ncbi:MAG: FliI/YscN family ATPase [Pseudomonadota bacterium]
MTADLKEKSGLGDTREHAGARRPINSCNPSDALLTAADLTCAGRVLSVNANRFEISDALGLLSVGARVRLQPQCMDGFDLSASLYGEVVSFGNGRATAMAFGPLTGVRCGDRVLFERPAQAMVPGPHWIGRVVDGLAMPLDGKGPLCGAARAPAAMPVFPSHPSPIPAPLRARLGPPVHFGVRALDSFTPARAGQRLGLFSGAGVGKSALLGMLARHTDCDVRIIALIGERGREVREFIERDLGPRGLENTIVVVATADQPALMRRQAGFLAMALAEHYRDQGRHVLCLMDSLTRIAAAQREIGLSAGEPPAARGFTPSVFALLPALLERAGPGLDHGSGDPGYITGVFTVLVEGDDANEPVADHCRASLDGHVVLDRAIAERGRFPAVNILKSLSRTAGDLLEGEAFAAYRRARAIAALYTDMEDMIRIGAYAPGTNPALDEAINFWPRLEEFLTQTRDADQDVRGMGAPTLVDLVKTGTASEG